MQRSYYPQRPIMAFPPYHSNHTAPVYPIWGQPGSHPAGVHMWGPPGYPAWQPTDNWHWKPYPGVKLKLMHVFVMTHDARFVLLSTCTTPKPLNFSLTSMIMRHWICMFDIFGLF